MPLLSEDALHDVGFLDSGEALIQALEGECQFLVIDSKLVQERRV